jgi:hypothetical protein
MVLANATIYTTDPAYPLPPIASTMAPRCGSHISVASMDRPEFMVGLGGAEDPLEGE